jgi:hypothetical protein
MTILLRSRRLYLFATEYQVHTTNFVIRRSCTATQRQKFFFTYSTVNLRYCTPCMVRSCPYLKIYQPYRGRRRHFGSQRKPEYKNAKKKLPIKENNQPSRVGTKLCRTRSPKSHHRVSMQELVLCPFR